MIVLPSPLHDDGRDGGRGIILALFLTQFYMAPRAARTPRQDFISVDYAQLGQPRQSTTLEPGSTVSDFREEAGIEDNIQIKRAGVVLDEDDELQDNDILFLNPKRVTGGTL